MPELVRTSVSIEKPLFKRLEKLVRSSRYTNRSEFLRDLIRERLVQEEWEHDREVVGTITLIYDHHVRLLNEKLTDLQHDHHDTVLVRRYHGRSCGGRPQARYRPADVRHPRADHQRGFRSRPLQRGAYRLPA